MDEALTLRPARAGDIAGIGSLVNGYAAERLMLPRSAESIALALDDFVVVVDDHDRVVACGALKTYSPSLAEVASLAVSREMRNSGLGSVVVAEVERLARVRGIVELFALTLASPFFESLGYEITDRARYPEKIRRDCASCPRRFACREVCVWRALSAMSLSIAA